MGEKGVTKWTPFVHGNFTCRIRLFECITVLKPKVLQVYVGQGTSYDLKGVLRRVKKGYAPEELYLKACFQCVFLVKKFCTNIKFKPRNEMFKCVKKAFLRSLTILRSK